MSIKIQFLIVLVSLLSTVPKSYAADKVDGIQTMHLVREFLNASDKADVWIYGKTPTGDQCSIAVSGARSDQLISFNSGQVGTFFVVLRVDSSNQVTNVPYIVSQSDDATGKSLIVSNARSYNPDVTSASMALTKSNGRLKSAMYIGVTTGFQMNCLFDKP